MQAIAIADGAADVALLVGALEAHGFDPVTADRQTGLVLSHWALAIGGVKIYVPTAQAKTATDVLGALGMPVWSRPRPWWIVVFILAFVVAAIPPPGQGNSLRRGCSEKTGLQARTA